MCVQNETSHQIKDSTSTILGKQDLPQLDPAAQFVPCGLLLFPYPQSLHTVPLDTTKQLYVKALRLPQGICASTVRNRTAVLL